MHEMKLVDYVTTWCQANVQRAQASKIRLTFGTSEEDRPNPSAWVTGAAADRVADLVVWASGDAQFGYGAPGRTEAEEHHDLASTYELEKLLERLLLYVRG